MHDRLEKDTYYIIAGDRFEVQRYMIQDLHRSPFDYVLALEHYGRIQGLPPHSTVIQAWKGIEKVLQRDIPMPTRFDDDLREVAMQMQEKLPLWQELHPSCSTGYSALSHAWITDSAFIRATRASATTRQPAIARAAAAQTPAVSKSVIYGGGGGTFNTRTYASNTSSNESSDTDKANANNIFTIEEDEPDNYEPLSTSNEPEPSFADHEPDTYYEDNDNYDDGDGYDDGYNDGYEDNDCNDYYYD